MGRTVGTAGGATAETATPPSTARPRAQRPSQAPENRCPLAVLLLLLPSLATDEDVLCSTVALQLAFSNLFYLSSNVEIQRC